MEQFLLLAKSAKGAAAAELTLQALNSSSLFVFAELLSQPNILDLQREAHLKPYCDLLLVFAYGTYADLLKNMANFATLPISENMKTKLKQLTIVTLAARNKRLPYVLLLQELSLSNVRELEDLIIDAIYNGVIFGKLDQRNQTLEIERCMGRDVKLEDLTGILLVLESFCERCQNMLGCMEAQIRVADKTRADSLQSKQKVEQEFANVKKALKAAASSSGQSSEFYDNSSLVTQDVSSSSTSEPPEKKKDRMVPTGRRIGSMKQSVSRKN